MSGLIVSIILLIIGAASAIGVSLAKQWFDINAYAEANLKVDVDVEPKTEIEMFEPLTVKIKVSTSTYIFDYLAYKWKEVELDFASGYAKVEFPGTYTGASFTLTSHLGEGQATFPVVLPAGSRNLLINLTNLKFLHPIFGYIPEFGYTASIPITVKRPRANVSIKLSPEVPTVGQECVINGKITIEGHKLKDFEAYMRDSVVEIYLDGRSIGRAPINIEDETFTFKFKPTEPGSHLLYFEIKAVETYAYIGVWASLSLVFSATGELKVTPLTVSISNLSPSVVYEGDLISVNALTYPNKIVTLYFDDVSVDKKLSDEKGKVTLEVPSKYVKAGTHTVRVEVEGVKEAIDSSTIVVSSMPKEKAEEVKVSCTLGNKTLTKGGIYEVLVDAMKGDKFIPMHILTVVGTLKEWEADCIKGRAALRYHFPMGVYKERMIIPIKLYITANGKMFTFSGEITLG